jgi:hypothetical protein
MVVACTHADPPQMCPRHDTPSYHLGQFVQSPGLPSAQDMPSVVACLYTAQPPAKMPAWVACLLESHLLSMYPPALQVLGTMRAMVSSLPANLVIHACLGSVPTAYHALWCLSLLGITGQAFTASPQVSSTPWHCSSWPQPMSSVSVFLSGRWRL